MHSFKNEEMYLQRTFWRKYFKLNAICWHLNEKIPIYWDIYIDDKAHFMTATFTSALSRTLSEKQLHIFFQYFFFNFHVELFFTLY